MKLENKVKQTIKKYKLCNKKEKVLVALSGGKDSTVTAYLLKNLGYKIEGIHLDLRIGDYSETCKNKVIELCKKLEIPLHIYDMKKEMGSGICYLRSAIQSKQVKGKLKNCAICGVIKKWIFNREARKLKASKVATGHNLDDEAQTFLMNIFKGSPKLSANIGPITKNLPDIKGKFIPRIKPLFYIAEENIKKYSKCPKSFDFGATKSKAVPTHRRRGKDFVGLIIPDFKGPSAIIMDKCNEKIRSEVNELIKAYSKRGNLKDRKEFDKYKL